MTPAERNVLSGVFTNWDFAVARGVEKERLHRGTVLFVMKQFALEVEKVDRAFGAELVAWQTEKACAAREQQQEGAATGYGG